MAKMREKKYNNLTDSTKIKLAIDFVEELSWLLESKNKISLSEVPEILRKGLDSVSDVENTTKDYISPNPNIHYLIGVLPRLFEDRKIFEKNEDIATFAEEILKVPISRPDKRSRYELIGLIVCKCNAFDDSTLQALVESLSKITGNSDKINQMAKEKSNVGFSWNETVRKLAE